MERQAIVPPKPEMPATEQYLLNRKREVARRARELQRRPAHVSVPSSTTPKPKPEKAGTHSRPVRLS
jgi:hypothetical protein